MKLKELEITREEHRLIIDIFNTDKKYDLIYAELLGNISRIELFAREQIGGWDCWGDEMREKSKCEK